MAEKGKGQEITVPMGKDIVERLDAGIIDLTNLIRTIKDDFLKPMKDGLANLVKHTRVIRNNIEDNIKELSKSIEKLTKTPIIYQSANTLSATERESKTPKRESKVPKKGESEIDPIEISDSPKIQENEKAKISESQKQEPDTLNEIITIEGTIKGMTAKGLLIEFSEGREAWFPKSRMHSNHTEEKGIVQEFAIERWLLKKQGII